MRCTIAILNLSWRARGGGDGANKRIARPKSSAKSQRRGGELGAESSFSRGVMATHRVVMWRCFLVYIGIVCGSHVIKWRRPCASSYSKAISRIGESKRRSASCNTSRMSRVREIFDANNEASACLVAPSAVYLS